MTDHADLALQFFTQGYNCAQAVLCAFGDVTNMETDAAARLASSFGGGLGRLREVCGAVSGAAMVLGIARGYSDPGDPERKKEHYHLVQAFAQRFREENGSIICRELLGGTKVRPGNDPEARSPQFYRDRPCASLVRSAARILDGMLDDNAAGT